MTNNIENESFMDIQALEHMDLADIRERRDIFGDFARFVARNRTDLTREQVVNLVYFEIDVPDSEARPGHVPAKFIKPKFELLAPQWKNIETFDQYISGFATLIQQVQFSPSDKILSVGSGPGLHEVFLAKYVVPQGKVICLDLAHNMNLETRKLAQKEGITNIEFVTAEGDHLPFLDKSFDHVISLNALNWMTGWKNSVRETRRVVKEDEKSRIVFCISNNDFFAGDLDPNNLIGQIYKSRIQPQEGTLLYANGQTRTMVPRFMVVAKPV